MMYQAPEKSPWGKVQTCDVLAPGVFLVSTASHGGTMVSKEVSAFLSPAAKRCGFKRSGFLCFEEDAQESVVLRELLDKKLWRIPERIKDKAAFEEGINKSIRPDSPGWKRQRPPAGRLLPARVNDSTSSQLGPRSERRFLWPMCRFPKT